MPQYTLMAHQKGGVDFLDRMEGVGALLMDPGVGKTGTTLAWADKQAATHGEFRILVVSPLVAADTWVLQAAPFMDSMVKARMLQGSTTQVMKMIRAGRKWTTVPETKIKSDHPGTRASQITGQKVTILSMSSGAVSSFCKKRPQIIQMMGAIRAYDPHLIVVDESHTIKSPTSNVSEALYYFGALAPHRIILTGTVNPKDILDVFGQWRFMAPWTFSDQYGTTVTEHPAAMTVKDFDSIKPWSWGRFKARYTRPGGYMGKGIGGYQNEDEIRERVAERSYVVRKEDALDLPPVNDVDVPVLLSTAESRAYKEMREDLATMLASGELLEATNPLAKIMKLRQITSGFAKDTETGETHILGSSKRQRVKDLVEVTLANEDRIVVFAYFTAECRLIADSLRKKGVTVEVVTGATKPDERLAIRQRFADVSGNPERTILVAQQRTMSVSVNELVTAQHAVYASMSERREDWVQSRGRLDRNGQTGSSVTFWRVMVPDSIDQIMLERHEGRGELEDALLEHIKGAAAAAPKRKRTARKKDDS